MAAGSSRSLQREAERLENLDRGRIPENNDAFCKWFVSKLSFLSSILSKNYLLNKSIKIRLMVQYRFRLIRIFIIVLI